MRNTHHLMRRAAAVCYKSRMPLKTFACAVPLLLLAACAPAPTPDLRPSVEAALTEMVREATARAPAPISPPPSATPAATATPVPSPTATPEPTAPRGDGKYLVGPQMARGRWQSDGGAEGDCYWISRHADGIILQSYFGPPGGQMELGDYDYEVETQNCGVWQYLGP
jgi:hypothetical protein